MQAQLCIFNHLKEEGMANGKDVRLTVEVLVPFNLIDKLTGRGSAMVSAGCGSKELVNNKCWIAVADPRHSDTDWSSSECSTSCY